MTDYSELKILAEAATPGPWKQEGVQGTQYGQVVGVYVAQEEGARIGQTFVNCLVKTAEQCQANAEFIAAANPIAVLALIAENERLQAGNEFQRDQKCAALNRNLALQQEIDQLKAENEALRKDAELYQQVERAAGELPAGWEIRICVERDAGNAELWDEDGCEVDFPNSCETLALTVSDAIDYATGKETSHD